MLETQEGKEIKKKTHKQDKEQNKTEGRKVSLKMQF